MGQLEDLQRNRMARMQNIQKGFCGDDNQDDIVKAHQQGDIHPNGKWYWESSAAGGKGDWRMIPKGAKSTQHMTDVTDDVKKKTEKKMLDLLAVSNSEYNDISKVSVFKTQKGNWGVMYDGHSVFTVGGDQFTEAQLKAAGILEKEDDNKGGEQQKPAKKEKPDFSPKYPDEIAKLTPRSDFSTFEAAYKKIGEDIFAEKYPDDKAWNDAVASRKTLYNDKQKEISYLGKKEAGVWGVKNPSNTSQIAAMKQYYEKQAAVAEEAWTKKQNDEYWAGAGAAQKQKLQAESQSIQKEMEKNIEDFTADFKSMFPYSTDYVAEVSLPNYKFSDARVQLSLTGRGWADIDVSFKNNQRYDAMTDPKKTEGVEMSFTPEINMSSQRVELKSGSSDFEKTKFTLTMAAELMKDGVADEISKKMAEMGKKQVKLYNRLKSISDELNADHSMD